MFLHLQSIQRIHQHAFAWRWSDEWDIIIEWARGWYPGKERDDAQIEIIGRGVSGEALQGERVEENNRIIRIIWIARGVCICIRKL